MALKSQPQTSKLRVSSQCDLQKIRPMTKAIRDFLTAEGLVEEEIGACELALVEACNNAVLYATQKGKKHPVEVEIEVGSETVLLKVHDHTAGFRLPDLANLPEQDSEHGRGLFIMRSLMDRIDYTKRTGGNTLTLQKNRSISSDGVITSPAAVRDLQNRLIESEQIITDMTNELSSCYEGLSAILRAGAEIGKSSNLAEFSESLGKQLLEITNSDWFVLRVVPKHEARLVVYATYPRTALEALSTGVFCDTESTAEIKAAVSARDVWFNARNPLDVCDPLRRSMPPSFGLVHPFFFADTLMGTLTVGKHYGRPAFNAANAQVIHTFAEFLGIQIANARLRDEQLNHQLLARELEIARDIQLRLLPRALPSFEHVKLAACYESARQVGGDFYDVIVLQDGLLLVIADVMGKGVPAAMFAAIFRSVLRSSPELNSQPGKLLARVNRLLYADLSDVDMFITAQVLYLDVRNCRVTAANAGHCPVLLTTGASTIKTLVPDGLPIGILPEASFLEQTEEFTNNARLLLYTDGLTETRNPQGEFFGQQRLTTWLQQNRNLRAEPLRDALVSELASFRGNAPLHDDETFLIVAEDKN